MPDELAASPDFDDFTCLLCWAKFDGPGDLAQHEQEEEERVYLMALDHEPSTNAETK